MDYVAAGAFGLIAVALLLLVLLAISANLFLHKLHGLAKAGQNRDAAARLLSFYNNGFIAEHRRALAAGDSSAPVISHSLSLAAQSMLRAGDRKPGTTVMCCIAVGDGYRESVEPCLESQRRYAERHGIDYVLITETPPRFERPIPWMKISLITRLLNDGYRRVIYIDADALITNDKISAEPYFETLERKSKPLLITEDSRGVNTGVLFVSNRPEALRLMDLIWRYDVDLNNPTWEQNATNVLLNTFPEFRAAFEIDPVSRHFNAFPPERREFITTGDNQIWQAGDFICHFCGIRRPQLTDIIRKYAGTSRSV